MSSLSRRDFVQKTALAAAFVRLPGLLEAEAPGGGVSPPPGPWAGEGVELHWLDGAAPRAGVGATWGVPWPRGRHAPGRSFALRSPTGEPVPVQSWPLATWPDGSLKWSAHAVAIGHGMAAGFALVPGAAAPPPRAVSVADSPDAVEVDTGVIRCRLGKGGADFIAAVTRDGREIATDGRLVCLLQDRAAGSRDRGLRVEAFAGAIGKVEVEQSGPVRAVVRIDGRHVAGNGRAWLPFTLRLYFYAGAEAVRIVHSFAYDGDPARDFIRGLGVRFSVPMRDPLHDRHVRFAGEDGGLWAEGVRNLTGLRRSPGRSVVEAQLDGRPCPPMHPAVASRLDLIPAFGDCKLDQPTPDSFSIRKRTGGGFAWIDAGHGRRAPGLGYVGGVSGGAAFGLRDFWQRHPTQLEVRGAAGERAEVTLWLWSPDAPAMDLRPYHGEMGMRTYAMQTEGLDITYEDYEPGFDSATGVARTSEIALWALPATPPRERLVELAAAVARPPVLAVRPAYLHSIPLFGGLWSLEDRSTPAKARIEARHDSLVDLYLREVDQRRWYGFWNYGDVMHTYDPDRHVWRYDVGGYAWDNSELSSDLWLWTSFLRSGRADLFRLAEAMTRHTFEVDVYHLGRFAGLGTRHGVLHWGDSAKQVRISTCAYRRMFYYLTADERVGDLMRALVACDGQLAKIDPGRKLPGRTPNSYPARVSWGTDWASFVAAWLTEWERTGDVRWRDKILTGMRCIGESPLGFFAPGFGYDPATGMLYDISRGRPGVSHLNGVFGAVETFAELIDTFDVPEFERAWLRYCELYNAGRAEQARVFGRPFRDVSLRVAHSRLTAYAGRRTRNPELRERAWREFFDRRESPFPGDGPLELDRVSGPAVLNPVAEAPRVSTNAAAQWGLAAIENLTLAGDRLPAS